MVVSAKRIALLAKWLIPVSTPPIEGGIITIQGDRIIAVGENLSGSPPHDLGEVALVPGFVNPHTHLEFSELQQPLGEPGMAFSDWIDMVVAQRRADQSDLQEHFLDTRRLAILAGMQESLRAGVTTLCEISTIDLRELPSPPSSLRVAVMRELIGLTSARADDQLNVARDHLDSDVDDECIFQLGISPHAPYTVARELVINASRLSRSRGTSLAMHLAESPEEIELLRSGKGPFRDLLQRQGVWNADAFPGHSMPLDYLRWLAEAGRSLIIHGNYLEKPEWEFLASRSSNMHLVYCPRTHRFFRHRPYPLAALLKEGVSVVIGTDSRASNPDLSMLEELRYVSQTQPHVGRREILSLGTLAAAHALGCHDVVGSLTPGKRADVAVVELISPVAADPYEALFDTGTRVRSTICGGQLLAARDGSGSGDGNGDNLGLPGTDSLR